MYNSFMCLVICATLLMIEMVSESSSQRRTLVSLSGILKTPEDLEFVIAEQENYRTIHVKFDEIITMDFKRNNLEPDSNHMIFKDPSAEPYQVPLKEDLDELLVPLYEEYFKGKTPNVTTSDNFAAPDTPHDTSSSTTILVDADIAPHIMSTSIEKTPP
ncbi:hypothetical protein Tco_1369996 [Tanacetum coccineum]